MMKFHKEALKNLLANASFQDNGDYYEKLFGQRINPYFPNSERFWRDYIIPATRRIENYPESLSKDVRFRINIDSILQEISAIHYSMFLNLGYAHIHAETKLISYVEDVYIHLGSACDLAETLIEKIYFLITTCRGEKIKILEKLSREDFLNLAGTWYDERYPTLYEHYLSKGKMQRINIISRTNILHEFFKNYLQIPDLWRKYTEISRIIREFRNVVVHDVQIVRGMGIDQQDWLIPKPSLIQRYRYWGAVSTMARSQNNISEDFVLASKKRQKKYKH